MSGSSFVDIDLHVWKSLDQPSGGPGMIEMDVSDDGSLDVSLVITNLPSGFQDIGGDEAGSCFDEGQAISHYNVDPANAERAYLPGIQVVYIGFNPGNSPTFHHIVSPKMAILDDYGS